MAEPGDVGVRPPESPEKALERLAAGVRSGIRADRRQVPARLQPVLDYLQAHLFDPGLGVQRMLTACGIRDHSIRTLFKTHLGTSPADYVTAARLEVAEALLLETRLPVWQIGRLVGYAQASVFSAAFRRSRALPPGAFREAARKGGSASSGGTAFPTVALLRRALAGGLAAEEARRLRRWLRAAIEESAVAERSRNGNSAVARTIPEGRRWNPRPFRSKS